MAQVAGICVPILSSPLRFFTEIIVSLGPCV